MTIFCALSFARKPKVIPLSIRRKGYIILKTMDRFDPAGQEFLRISERYRQMKDEELLVLIPQSSELTPFAQEALATEVRRRGLKREAEEASIPSRAAAEPPARFEHETPKFHDSADGDTSETDSFDDADSSYDEDRKLVELCTVYSVRDALQVQAILDGAGIPFFMGAEKATDVDKVTSNFPNGVGVQIMKIGLPWATQPMRHFEPEDDPTPPEKEQFEEIPVRCPKCHSMEVVFENRTSAPGGVADESSEKFKWTCDSRGQQWEDDGVAQEQ